MILSEQQAINLVRENLRVSRDMEELRHKSKTLYALVDGDDFKDELIDRIEFIESSKKAKARKKYARDIQDFFVRLFQPMDNIWYATGGNKVYDIKDKDVKKQFLHRISNIKNNNTLSHWVQNEATKKLKIVDPNGLIFLEYTLSDVFPTYKGINTIRAYKAKGQLLDWVIFEPKMVKISSMGLDIETYRIVDDDNDRTFMVLGQDISIIESESFQHPFGKVPAIINSNLKKTGDNYFISPIEPIIGIAKEYARDLTIKTLYKFTQGFPIHWRYVTECDDCKGRGKIDNKTCDSCDGKGYLTKGDVTDIVTLPMPTTDGVVAPKEIAGHIDPSLATLIEFGNQLLTLERDATMTFWGTPLNSIETFGGRKTTTEVLFNKQPIENRLNEFADYAEFVEWQLSEWILNYIDRAKSVDEENITISYGRNYVIEPSDTILKRYTESKAAQENDVILDELFRELLQATYRTNPVELHKNLLKSKVEPYIHQTLKDVFDIFGSVEAQRKVLFGKWWDTLNDFTKSKEDLIIEYDKWFELKKIVPKVTTKVN